MCFDNFLRVGKFAACVKTIEFNRQKFVAKFVPVGKIFSQGFDFRTLVGENFHGDSVFVGKPLSFGAVVGNFFQRVGNVRAKNFKPFCVFKSGVRGQIVRLGKRIQPRFGVRNAQRKFVQVDNHVVNVAVAFDVAAEFVRKIFKSLTARRIIFLKKFFDDFMLEQIQFVFVRRAKFRVEVD